MPVVHLGLYRLPFPWHLCSSPFSHHLIALCFAWKPLYLIGIRAECTDALLILKQVLWVMLCGDSHTIKQCMQVLGVRFKWVRERFPLASSVPIQVT